MDDDDLEHTRKAFPDAEQFKLMRKKGMLPYDLITSVEKIRSKTPIEFPNKDSFLTKLTDEPILDEQW